MSLDQPTGSVKQSLAELSPGMPGSPLADLLERKAPAESQDKPSAESSPLSQGLDLLMPKSSEGKKVEGVELPDVRLSDEMGDRFGELIKATDFIFRKIDKDGDGTITQAERTNAQAAVSRDWLQDPLHALAYGVILHLADQKLGTGKLPGMTDLSTKELTRVDLSTWFQHWLSEMAKVWTTDESLQTTPGQSGSSEVNPDDEGAINQLLVSGPLANLFRYTFGGIESLNYGLHQLSRSDSAASPFVNPSIGPTSLLPSRPPSPGPLFNNRSPYQPPGTYPERPYLTPPGNPGGEYNMRTTPDGLRYPSRNSAPPSPRDALQDNTRFPTESPRRYPQEAIPPGARPYGYRNGEYIEFLKDGIIKLTTNSYAVCTAGSEAWRHPEDTTDPRQRNRHTAAHHSDGSSMGTDSECWISLPADLLPNIPKGTPVLVRCPQTGKMVAAVVGEVGPRGKLGEGSVRLLKELLWPEAKDRFPIIDGRNGVGKRSGLQFEIYAFPEELRNVRNPSHFLDMARSPDLIADLLTQRLRQNRNIG